MIYNSIISEILQNRETTITVFRLLHRLFLLPRRIPLPDQPDNDPLVLQQPPNEPHGHINQGFTPKSHEYATMYSMGSHDYGEIQNSPHHYSELQSAGNSLWNMSNQNWQNISNQGTPASHDYAEIGSKVDTSCSEDSTPFDDDVSYASRSDHSRIYGPL